MPPRASSPTERTAAERRQSHPGRLLQEVIWGRPVFRPPELTNPKLVFDPLPFRTQHFPSRATGK
jgi:hypothetical protein